MFMNLPNKLLKQLDSRKETNALRTLKTSSNLVDFSSNDYLGFAKSDEIFHKVHQFLVDNNIKQNGATGSRLLTGNHFLYNEVESLLNEFHQSESATIFNSGYDANIGFFASVPQRGDVILYDELIHASIRDGFQLSNAKAFKFLHNNLEDLEAKIIRQNINKENIIYVVVESVFSMDGDSPDLIEISKTCKKHNVFLIVDEAHALGVFSSGLVQKLSLQNDVFARIVTFGKAMGCHGAAILGSLDLQTYLVNFARSFIYTTGLSPQSIATIKVAYQYLGFPSTELKKCQEVILRENIQFFISEVKRLNLNFIASCSAIHCCVFSGNEKVKSISEKLQKKGFDVKAILSPTVAKGKERLRFCLHSYNSKQEITEVLELLSIFVN